MDDITETTAMAIRWIATDPAAIVKLASYFPGAGERVGKKAAGRLLDGRTWDEFPAEARLASEVR